MPLPLVNDMTPARFAFTVKRSVIVLMPATVCAPVNFTTSESFAFVPGSKFPSSHGVFPLKTGRTLNSDTPADVMRKCHVDDMYGPMRNSFHVPEPPPD